MKGNEKISIIIPCYNDVLKINDIVGACLKFERTGEVIVVDDGSNNSTYKVLKKIKNVILMRHSSNLGKSAAMKTGLLNSKYKYISYIDSDLIGFKTSHLRLMYKKMINGDYDMIIADREVEYFIHRMFLGVIVNGERMIKRNILIENINIFEAGGYFVEVEMNKIFYRKYKVGTVVLPELTQVHKFDKGGFRGLLKDLYIMNWQIPNRLGLREFVWQAWKSKKLG